MPAAVSVFPHEIYKAPRSWAEKAYPKLMYFNELDGATTSPPGRSLGCSRPNSAPPSGHCANRPLSGRQRVLSRRGPVGAFQALWAPPNDYKDLL